jgi:Na+/H+ antiporter NhaD/arsenite permease-like protein
VVAAIIAAGLGRVVFGGFAADLAAITVISLGLGAIVLLVFFEVGLSEDREREREQAAREKRTEQRHEKKPPRTARWRRRPG